MPPLTRPETHYARSQRAIAAPCACVTEGTVFTRRVRRESRPNVPRTGRVSGGRLQIRKCRGSWADVEKRSRHKSLKNQGPIGVSIDFDKQPISFVRNESPRRSERSSDSIGCLARSTNRVIARLTESKIRSRRVGPHRIVHVCFRPGTTAMLRLRCGSVLPLDPRAACAQHTRARTLRGRRKTSASDVVDVLIASALTSVVGSRKGADPCPTCTP